MTAHRFGFFLFTYVYSADWGNKFPKGRNSTQIQFKAILKGKRTRMPNPLFSPDFAGHKQAVSFLLRKMSLFCIWSLGCTRDGGGHLWGLQQDLRCPRWRGQPFHSGGSSRMNPLNAACSCSLTRDSVVGWHLAQELPKSWAQFCGSQLMSYTLCDPPRAKLHEFLPKLLGATEERAWLMSDVKDEVQSLKPELNFSLAPERFGFFFCVFF